MTAPARLRAADGAKLAFRDEQLGAGGPVLLALAGLTRTMADFDYVLPHLPACRLIRMDYRGRGNSDWTGADTYTVAQEALDALDLMDHLGLDRVAVLGTSRGGLIGLHLAATARDRLSGLCLNDIGPQIHRPGLERIFDYVGRNPFPKTHADLAARLPRAMPGFDNLPDGRWLAEAQKHYVQTDQGLRITYDPALREAFLAGFQAADYDGWAGFDACAGLPLALIRGANSDLLTKDTADAMQARRPDMIRAEVPDRAHVPFLDEPAAVTALHRFVDALR